MEYAMLSQVGDREKNDDYADVLILTKKDGCEGKGMFVLADGLGGHVGGAEASRFVVEACLEYFKKNFQHENILAESLEFAQQGLRKLQRERGMSGYVTTIVVLLIEKDAISWAHVGDSRLYYFFRNKLQVRTLDHSVPQLLVQINELKESEIRNHPDRNRLLRAMGMEWEKPQYEISGKRKRKDKQAFLLCSDGFWEKITEKEMTNCLAKSTQPKEWLDSMNEIVQMGGERGGKDNQTAIAIFADRHDACVKQGNDIPDHEGLYGEKCAE